MKATRAVALGLALTSGAPRLLAGDCGPVPGVSWDDLYGHHVERGCSPYTVDWLKANHQNADNMWTAAWEIYVKDGLDGLKDLYGIRDGANGGTDGVDVRMTNTNFNTRQNEFQIQINPYNPQYAIGTSNDSMTAGVGIF